MEDLSKLSKAELLKRLKEKEEFEQSLQTVESAGDSEIDKLDRMVNETHPYKLEVSLKEDPESIMLYTAINKRVGPMHLVNARRTMINWKNAGIKLFLKPRTPEQIEEFKKTDDYKRLHAKHLAVRKLRKEASSKGKVENIAVEIAKETAKLTAAQQAALK